MYIGDVLGVGTKSFRIRNKKIIFFFQSFNYILDWMSALQIQTNFTIAKMKAIERQVYWK